MPTLACLFFYRFLIDFNWWHWWNHVSAERRHVNHTINFNLSSKKALEEGWIQNAEPEPDLGKDNIVEWAAGRLQAAIRQRLERYYTRKNQKMNNKNLLQINRKTFQTISPTSTFSRVSVGCIAHGGGLKQKGLVCLKKRHVVLVKLIREFFSWKFQKNHNKSSVIKVLHQESINGNAVLLSKKWGNDVAPERTRGYAVT